MQKTSSLAVNGLLKQYYDPHVTKLPDLPNNPLSVYPWAQISGPMEEWS